MEQRLAALERTTSDHGIKLAELQKDVAYIKEKILDLSDLNQIRELIMECITKKATNSDDGKSNATKTVSSEEEGKEEDTLTRSRLKKVELPTLMEDEPELEPESPKMTAQEGSLVEGSTKGGDEINIQSLKLGQNAVIMGPTQRLGAVLGEGRTDPMRAESGLKRMQIQKPPHILVIHLNRFKYMKQLGHCKKLSYWVVFPLEPKLSSTIEDAEAWHIDDHWKYPP